MVLPPSFSKVTAQFPSRFAVSLFSSQDPQQATVLTSKEHEEDKEHWVEIAQADSEGVFMHDRGQGKDSQHGGRLEPLREKLRYKENIQELAT